VEYHIRVNRPEIAVNVFLGTILLLTFTLPIFLGLLFLTYAIPLLNLAIETYLPDLDRRTVFDLVLYGLLSLWPLRQGIASLRRRLWTNAFLSFAIVPMMLSLSVRHSMISDSLLFASPWWLMFYITTDSELTRHEFMLGGFVISLTVAVNTGLLGSGTPAKLATYCVYMAMFALFGTYLNRERSKQSESAAPLV
jgi:hypothetical protein